MLAACNLSGYEVRDLCCPCNYFLWNELWRGQEMREIEKGIIALNCQSNCLS